MIQGMKAFDVQAWKPQFKFLESVYANNGHTYAWTHCCRINTGKSQELVGQWAYAKSVAWATWNPVSENRSY